MRRLWCNEEITLIGRKTLLEQKIKPRVDNPNWRFFLIGERDCGKTALLEAAFDLCVRQKKTLIHASKPHAEICKQIIRDWDLETDTERKTPTVIEMEAAILRTSGNVLFVDDLHRASAVKKIDFLRTLAERHKICGAVLSGAAKENLKPLLGVMGSEIRVPKLSRADAIKLSERVCVHLGSRLRYTAVANASKGMPGKIVAMAQANEIQRAEVRSSDEEINIAPLFLLCASCVILFRYIGRATDSSDLVLLGGVGVVFLIFLRAIFMRGSR